MSESVFPPAAEAAARAHVSSLDQYRELYDRSINDPEGFWTEHAQRLHWVEQWHTLRAVSYTHLTLPTTERV